MRLVPPTALFPLHQHFVVEEALSIIRHDLRNKLGSIRNAAFYVGRKLQKAAPELAIADPRVPEFLAMIGREINSAEEGLVTRLPEAQGAEVMTAPAILHRVHELVALPSNVLMIVEATSEPRLRISSDEACIALFCLIENAVDAFDGRAGNIRLRVADREGRVALEVADDGPGFSAGAYERAFEPFFTTRQARMGIGLNIARRIGTRWDGKVEVAPIESGGVCAAFAVKAEA